MATESKNVVDRIKDLTLCGICADMLTDARVLPCLHTFCLECLQLAGTDRRPYQRMPCPICRNEFSVPRNGFAGLQKNFLMENLLEMASLPSPSIQDEAVPDLGISFPCDVCCEAGTSENDEAPDETVLPPADRGTACPPVAVVYCVDCRQNLCRLCYNHHRRVPATKLHRFSDNPEIVEGFRRLIAENVDAVIAWMEEGDRKRQGVTEARTRYLEEATRAENDVTRARDDAKRAIDSRAESMLSELSQSTQKHLDEFRNDLDVIDGHLAILESFMKRCLHAKDAVADDVICRIGDDLNATAEDLRLIHKSCLEEQVPDVHVSFKSTDFDEFLERKQTETTANAKKSATDIGGDGFVTSDGNPEFSSFLPESAKKTGTKNAVAVLVVVSSVILAIFLNSFTPKVRLVSLQLTTRLHEGHSVMGVTSVDDHIFILSRSTKSILVYEAREPFVKVKQIPIPEVRSPWDITGSSDTNNLYISDHDQSCIWSVSLAEVAKAGWFSVVGYEHPVTLWLSGITEPYTLSMSRNGSVLLLRSGTPPRLEKYGPSGVLERSVELPLDVEDPRHLLETSVGTFVVSYGWSGTRTQGIVELSEDGVAIRTHDPIHDWQRLKNPYHLAIDDADRVFVADFYNNRLLLLVANGNGWDMRTLLDENRNAILKPHRLALSKRGHMILVHNDGQTVDMYNVTQSA